MSPLPWRVARTRPVILLATLLAIGCGAGKGDENGDRSDGSPELPDGQAPGPDSGQLGPDSGQPGPDSGQPGPGDAGAGPDAALPAVAYCTFVCTGPADCNQGSAPYDSDNYDCENNTCVYTGCNNDTECQALGNYVCRPSPGSVVPYCQRACATPGDCSLGSAPHGSDNYDCQDDVCVYRGCNDDAECQTLGNYLCRSSPGSVVPYCHPACAAPGDCNQVSAPYDSDNYDCRNDVCVYSGCNDDAECQALGNYVCSSGG